MATNKTVPTTIEPVDFIAGVEHDTRRADAEVLLEIMSRVTGFPPKMWGASIVGFGRYEYRYDSGREGEFLITGFAPGKSKMSIHLLAGFEGEEETLGRLGKHKHGVSCLYVNKLADIDLDVLEELITRSVSKMQAIYEWSAQ